MGMSMFEWIFKLYIFLVGLAIGSFLNVCIYRIPRKESIVFPRSRCPKCYHIIPWYYNIPILSWIILRGRCAWCKTSISLRYPLVEMWTGVTFYLAYLHWGFTIATAVILAFASILIILTFIDWDWQILPNRFTFTLIIGGCLWLPWNPMTTWKEGLAGLIVGFLFPMALIWFYWLIRREEGMGLGDVKLLGGIGVFLGWQKLLGILIFGSILGIVYALFTVLVHGKSENQTSFSRLAIPFGTFLCIATWIMLFWWDFWWKIYTRSMEALVEKVL